LLAVIRVVFIKTHFFEAVAAVRTYAWILSDDIVKDSNWLESLHDFLRIVEEIL
jgi:hypothetical protein